MIEAFPLTWPAGFERTEPAKKKNSQFQTTLGKARDRVLKEIERLKGTNVIISTNIPTKRDGNFYASMKPVDGDTGIAVYFTWKGDQYVLACDQYFGIHENVHAIALSIDAMRGLERWGASDILKRTFSGFKALPEQASASTGNWWSVMMLDEHATKEEVKAKWKSMTKYFHPDMPTGNRKIFEDVQEAYKRAMAQLK